MASSTLEKDLVRLRRDLHAEPEIGLDLPDTQARLLRELEQLPLEITLGRGCSSITAVLRATNRDDSTPAVLLRADMDALPVSEPEGLSFASRRPGIMHACGHDMHMTMLIGAVRILCAKQDTLSGDVVFMFQPGEEGWGGAAMMVEEGVLTAAGTEVSSAFGMHVLTGDVRPSRFSFRHGTAMAGASALTATVKGRGGHGSAPHLASDPVTTAAETVVALQSAVTRDFNAFDPVIVTVGSLHAGTRRNIIPDDARIEATVRCFTNESRDLAADVLTRVAKGVAAAHNQQALVEYEHEFRPLINTPSETDFAVRVARETFGSSAVELLEHPKTASEDFSEILQQVPGTFGFIDCTPDGGSDYNHSPRAVFDEDVLHDGAKMYAEFAFHKLKELRSSESSTLEDPQVKRSEH
ncbi:MAG: M20 metallopeptidase family protein [Gulosibacter sp.]|uniref:M20 metallopeptidase family protein n=1 Tax=Gulosibacter sp. TaxID=2817531 RepID=UPI003F92E0DE